MNEYDEVEKCVKNYIKTLNISQYQIQINRAKDLGPNFMSAIVEIIVQGKDEKQKQIEQSMIGKLAKKHYEFRQRVRVREIFLNETFIYEYILPEFEKLQTQRKIKNFFKSYPEFCVSSKEDLKETVVLKNMNINGFQLYDRKTTLDYDHALLLIKEIGRFHALSFAIRDQRPQVFSKIMDNLKEVEFTGKHAQLHKYCYNAIYLQCMRTLDPIKDKTILNQYKNVEKVFYDKVENALKTCYLGTEAVVTHSDLWIPNLLYKYQENNKPNGICLLDWQLTKVSSPASDISEIMFLCLEKDNRDKHYKNLIDEYYNTFSTFLRELGSNPEVMFPMCALQDHLKKFSIHGLYIALRTIAFTSTILEKTPHLSDNDAFDVMYNAKRDAELFNSRIRHILVDYIKYGYDL